MHTLLVILAHLVAFIDAIGEDDLVILPHVTFPYNFRSYSGYLHGDNTGTYKMFYWLAESQGNPATDPLVLWLNGGPGCSSLGGAFEELGPFHVNRDGHSLYENIYPWNKNASVLFLESPAGVGFSYLTTDVNAFDARGDDATAEANLNALNDFFSRVHPTYKNRTFFITGESYAGIYLPTLARLIIRSINANNFSNPNFQGVAIGNGWMNVRLQTNSYMVWSNYHGIVGVDEWRQIRSVCCKNNSDVDTCDFYGQIVEEIKASRTAKLTDSCWSLVMKFYYLSGNYDPYNFYQDCYQTISLRKARSFYRKAMLEEAEASNTAADLNYDSTDSQNGFPCWDDVATEVYLNLPEVMKALHIDNAWIEGRKIHWEVCNNQLNFQYKRMYGDTTEIFMDIINEVKIANFRILIYNGDLDTVCDFLGDAWHMSALARQLRMQSTNRVHWSFRNQLAGFAQRYYNNRTVLDVLTIKIQAPNITRTALQGAGHFVPNDRPGPSLQMLTNFLLNSANYSSTNEFDPMPHINTNRERLSCYFNKYSRTNEISDDDDV